MKLKTTAIIAATSLGLGSAQAAVISVNITDGGNGFATSASNIAGVVEAGYWNNASVHDSGITARSTTNASNLVDDSGASSSVSITASGVWGRTYSSASSYNTGTATFNNNMMTNWSDTQTGSISFSGISYSSYDIYVYSARPYNQEAGLTVGSTTFFLASDGSSMTGPFEQASFASQTLAEASRGTGNYMKFTGLTGSAVTISAENVGNYFSINGIQIVDTTVVPEPSSSALLGLGALALILRRRK